jgi:hypothetical protein
LETSDALETSSSLALVGGAEKHLGFLGGARFKVGVGGRSVF